MTRKQDYVNYFIFAGIYFARLDLEYALWQCIQGTFVTLTLTSGQAMRRGMEGQGRGTSGLRPRRGPRSNTNMQEGDLSAVTPSDIGEVQGNQGS